MRPELEKDDLLRALTLFGDRYHAVDVFADDLSGEARDLVEQQHQFQHQGKTYRFRVFRDRGVVRLERVEASDVASSAAAGAVVGAAVAAAAQQKGEGLLGGALLGLLVGGMIGAAAGDAKPRRVFAMQFDPTTRQWTSYDGALLRWMKDRLLVPNHVA